MSHQLETIIGYKFKNPELLEIALTHTSYANESRTPVKHNERLEFLGDSVLQIVSADYLFHAYADRPEGDLTRIRASLVSEGALFQFAQEIDLGEYLRLGRGEERCGGRNRPSVVSDAFEALIAALYLDGGMDVARSFILPFITEGKHAEADYKTRLQEIVQQNPEERLSYVVESESGPDHDKHFVVAVRFNSDRVARGEGRSKKAAEQCAEETEAHGDGQGELLQRTANALEAVPGNTAGEDYKIGQAAQCNGAIDIGQGSGQCNGCAADADGLYTEQLKQGPYKDVYACGKNVGTKKAVPMGRIALCQIVKQVHRLLQQHLQSAGHVLEVRNHENSDQCGNDQQKSRDDHAGDQTGIHIFQTKQADSAGFMQNRIPHGLLYGLLTGGGGNHNAGHGQYGNDCNPSNQKLFMFHRFTPFLQAPEANWNVKRSSH